jgi:hypothetical protein
MKKFFGLAVVASISAGALAQFSAGDLAVVFHPTSGTASANGVIQRRDGGSGSLLGTGAALTGLTLSTSSVAAYMRAGIDGSLYVGGLQAGSTTVGRIARANMSGTVDYANIDRTAARGAFVDDMGNAYVSDSNGVFKSTATVWDGTTLNTTANQFTASTTTRAGWWNNGIYYSRASSTSTVNGISSLSGGVGTQVGNNPGGVNATTGPSDFFISFDGLTMYVADERTTADGGILKFTRASNSGAFTYQYTLDTATGGARGASYVTAKEVSGVFTIFASTSESSNNRLVSIVDTGAGSTATLLDTAGTGNKFKGLAMVPEPATLAVMGLGLAGLAARRRRKQA